MHATVWLVLVKLAANSPAVRSTMWLGSVMQILVKDLLNMRVQAERRRLQEGMSEVWAGRRRYAPMWRGHGQVSCGANTCAEPSGEGYLGKSGNAWHMHVHGCSSCKRLQKAGGIPE